jgi:hypothetical protein
MGLGGCLKCFFLQDELAVSDMSRSYMYINLSHSGGFAALTSTWGEPHVAACERDFDYYRRKATSLRTRAIRRLLPRTAACVAALALAVAGAFGGEWRGRPFQGARRLPE